MDRRVIFEPQAFEDYLDWQMPAFMSSGFVAPMINQLIQMLACYGVSDTSTAVTYESEPAWSLHIWGKHHLIYQINDDEIRILSCQHRKPYVV